MKIAIVHDFLHQMGGAEKVLEGFKELYPEVPVFTLIYDPLKVPYQGWDIRPSKMLRRTPFKKHYKYFLPLFPKAVESFDLRDYDLILSSSYAWSKSIKVASSSCHICYCHTPMRFAYEMFSDYTKDFHPLKREIVSSVMKYLRDWDVKTSQRPTYYISNSQNVANRIKRYYQRDSTVIYPPVDTTFFQLNGLKVKDFYLIVSRLTPYKRVDLAIEAFNKLGKKLKIIGAGPEEKKLKRMAGKNIEFLGWVSDELLRQYYQQCQALIMPQEEDFGLVSLEAQACGRPVIAYGKGGSCESIIEGRTGLFFTEQNKNALIEALRKFEAMSFDSYQIRENALCFDKEIFKQKIDSFIQAKYSEFEKSLYIKKVPFSSLRVNDHPSSLRGAEGDEAISSGEIASPLPSVGARNDGERTKRFLDILLSLFLIPLLLLLIALIALAVKLDSPGPVIFTQKRVGKKGKQFNLYKFRTMVKEAEFLKRRYAYLNEAKGPVFKISNDPRLTRIGKWLRDTNLDELPQLFNVLKGQMSLVGPRPALPEEVAQYNFYQKRRLEVIPGMTSLLVVSGQYRVGMDFDEWVAWDLRYIQNRSLKLELRIILKTFVMLVKNVIAKRPEPTFMPTKQSHLEIALLRSQ